MAETFRNHRVVLADSVTTVYTVPAGTTAIVLGAQVANRGATANQLEFWWTDASAADVVTYLADEVLVPTQAAYEPIGGKLVLESGDRLQGAGQVASELEVTVSVLELS